MKKDDFGVWSVVVPAKAGQPAIPHNSKIKVSPIPSSLSRVKTNQSLVYQISMVTPSGERVERLPAWIK